MKNIILCVIIGLTCLLNINKAEACEVMTYKDYVNIPTGVALTNKQLEEYSTKYCGVVQSQMSFHGMDTVVVKYSGSSEFSFVLVTFTNGVVTDKMQFGLE